MQFTKVSQANHIICHWWLLRRPVQIVINVFVVKLFFSKLFGLHYYLASVKIFGDLGQKRENKDREGTNLQQHVNSNY